MGKADAFNFEGIYRSIQQIIELIASGSFGATESQVKNAIETATNLDEIENSLGNLELYNDGIEGLLSTISGQLPSSTNRTLYTALGSANAAVIKGSSGRLYGVICSHTATQKQYLQFFNQTTVPVNSTVPLLTLPMPAGVNTVDGGFVLSSDILGPLGHSFSTGIAWAFSTTRDTLTLGTAANVSIHAFYI